MTIGKKKIRSFSRLLSLIAILSLLGFVHAQDLSTSGEAITPYAPENPNGLIADETNVAKLKADAAKSKMLYGVPSDDSVFHPTISYIAFGYSKGGTLCGDLFYFFQGTNEEGDDQRIDFSEVEAFTLIQATGTTAVVEIEEFPGISVKELLTRQLSYVELLQRYRRVVQLELTTKDKTGAVLYLFNGEERKPILSLSRLRKWVRLPFYDASTIRGLWWATPSVTADSTYPRRRVMISQLPIPTASKPKRCWAMALAFGSPLVHELRYLRALRDRFLKPTAIGRLIINGYYTTSAWGVPYLESSSTLRAIARPVLVPIVYASKTLVGDIEHRRDAEPITAVNNGFSNNCVVSLK